MQPSGEYYRARSNGPMLDLWPEAHDAKRYAGPYPVVAHPPCTRWCSLARLVASQHPKDPAYAVGADSGCFRAALKAVRQWGGVLEHPAYSLACSKYKLTRPAAGGGWLNEREWVCELSQAAYGHQGRKLTWLLFVGRRPPFELDWSRPPARRRSCR